ncbi:murein hydrolase activator EnvC [Colwelliaceae bacterium BS250]
MFINHAHAQDNSTKKDLSDVKQQIEQQRSDLKKNNQQVSKIVQRLRTDDLAIAKTAAKMNDIKQQQKQTKQQITKLISQQQVLQKQKQQQEEVLAEQIRSAYSAGHHDYLKLLLNQQSPGKVQRSLTYYQYLNDARINSIENFEKVIVELKAVEVEQQQQAEKLQKLVLAQQQEKLELEGQRTSRKNTLKSLNSQVLSSKQRLNKLEGEEKSLIHTLAIIQARLQQAKELKGLSKLKNKLRWPAAGRLAHKFGTKKQGYLRWKGVHINARLGKSVKTIHNGTVLFADWLKGYGLVIVIDHGEGYMSLYGHNQVLLKGVGDRVEIGEPIALVGQSGGQSQAGVYFEIRHKGKPVNPKLWCK